VRAANVGAAGVGAAEHALGIGAAEHSLGMGAFGLAGDAWAEGGVGGDYGHTDIGGFIGGVEEFAGGWDGGFGGVAGVGGSDGVGGLGEVRRSAHGRPLGEVGDMRLVGLHHDPVAEVGWESVGYGAGSGEGGGGDKGGRRMLSAVGRPSQMSP